MKSTAQKPSPSGHYGMHRSFCCCASWKPSLCCSKRCKPCNILFGPALRSGHAHSATQSSNNPSCPSQRTPLMRVLMLHGKLVHLKKFPEGHQVKLFRLVSSTRVTEWIVTNNLLKLLTPKSQNRQRCAGRSSSFTANGNKPPEFNVANAENKEPNTIISRPRCWLGPIFISQQC